jgi:hypothetical protein
MTLKITDKEDYLLVEPSEGMDYWEILEAIPAVFLMPQFKDKDDIWVFRKGQMKIHYSDLNTLKGVAEKLHPEESNGRKTAIVTETGSQQALASLYSDIGKDLPREIKIFSDLKLAEDWIKQNSVQDLDPSFSVASS